MNEPSSLILNLAVCYSQTRKHHSYFPCSPQRLVLVKDAFAAVALGYWLSLSFLFAVSFCRKQWTAFRLRFLLPFHGPWMSRVWFLFVAIFWFWPYLPSSPKNLTLANHSVECGQAMDRILRAVDATASAAPVGGRSIPIHTIEPF